MLNDPEEELMEEAIRKMEADIRKEAKAHDLSPWTLGMALKPELEARMVRMSGNRDGVRRMLDLLMKRLRS